MALGKIPQGIENRAETPEGKTEMIEILVGALIIGVGCLICQVVIALRTGNEMPGIEDIQDE